MQLKDAHPHTIGFIHGHGLYMGVEIVGAPPVLSVLEAHAKARSAPLPPGTARARSVCDRMLELGVVCHATGDHSNVIKVSVRCVGSS